jgi:oleandomycin transport system permease protein
MTRLFRHSAALAQRNLIGVTRSPEAFIDVTLQPIIFIGLFTVVFGGAVAHGSRHAYLQFLLPGVLAQLVAFAGVPIGVNLNSDIEKGVFDRFRSLPIPRAAPLVGSVLADVVRYLVLCLITLGFGYVIGFRATTGAPAVLAAGLLAIAFAMCLSWASVWVGMLARTPGAVQGLMLLFLFPLTFGTSIFVPAKTLPGWVQTLSDVNPLTHLVEALRELTTGGPAGTDVAWTLGWMAAMLVVFVPLALRAYGRRA